MRRKQKILPLILSVCIAIPALAGITSVNADSVDDFTLPDIVDSDEARQNGYIGRATEEEKDLYTFVFQNGSGSKTMRVYSHPVKYVASNGEIRDISLEVQKKAGGGFITADHEIITAFEQNLTDGISLTYHDIEVTLVPNINTNTASAATLGNGNKLVTYILDDTTSLEYSLTYAGFKEDIVVNRYTGQTEYDFTLYTNGLTLCEEFGSYYLANSDGVKEATIGDIIVFTADEHNNTLGSMTYETVQENQEYILTIHLDNEYLSDEATAYPIRIDPTIEINYNKNGAGAIEDVTIREGTTYAGDSGSLYVGRFSDGSRARALMRFPLLEMPVTFGPMILSAQVELRDLMCQDNQDFAIYCYEYMKSAPSWSESDTTTWTSVGNSYASGVIQDYHLISYGKGNVEAHRYAFDITQLAKEWANGTASPSKGIVFKASYQFESQTDNNWYKTFASYNRSSNRPSLFITYETKIACWLTVFASETKYLTVSSSNTSDTSVGAESLNESTKMNGTALWCIEYVPAYNAYKIISMGKRLNNGLSSYAIYNTVSTAGLMDSTSTSTSILYFLKAASATSYYFQNLNSGRYLSWSNTSGVLAASQVMDINSRINVQKIQTDTFNNFWSGSYTHGIYNGVAHIQINIDNSINSSPLFKDVDIVAIAKQWNGISSNVIIYGPKDNVPVKDPFIVTFAARDIDTILGLTLENGLTYEKYVEMKNAEDSDKQISELASSDWDSVTIYLNNGENFRDYDENVFLFYSSTDEELSLLITSVICHEMGHALKLSHPNDSTIHTWNKGRGEYSTKHSVYSVMNSGFPYNWGDYRLVSTLPQYHDIINLISKWEYHINCSH